jgi:hypothetical protein
MSSPAAATLLNRAARLYRDAGLDDDACRCLERSGDFAAAGLIHRHAGRFAEAAFCFERAGQTLQAARAHESAGSFADAARCYEATECHLEAAWLLAHRLGSPARALAMVAHLPESDRDTALAVALVRARCRAATRPREAAAELRRVIVGLASDRAQAFRYHLTFSWALAVADSLNRPDLTASLYAIHPDGTAAWAGWARSRLGTADGVPTSEPRMSASGEEVGTP